MVAKKCRSAMLLIICAWLACVGAAASANTPAETTLEEFAEAVRLAQVDARKAKNVAFDNRTLMVAVLIVSLFGNGFLVRLILSDRFGGGTPPVVDRAQAARALARELHRLTRYTEDNERVAETLRDLTVRSHEALSQLERTDDDGEDEKKKPT